MRQLRKLTQSFTRPSNTDAYADGDLIANSVTAGSVSPMKFYPGAQGWRIVQARVSKSDETDVANSGVTLHLFDSSPTVANGDNGALLTTLGGFLGNITFATMIATFVSDEGYQFVTLGSTALPGGLFGTSNTVYALLEADAGYTPASAEVFTVTLWFECY